MNNQTALGSLSGVHANGRSRDYDRPERALSERSDPEPCFIGERGPSKEHESAADLIWKEKLDMSVSPAEAVVSLLATGVFVGLMLALGY
jgi:hypothetical protein